MRNIDNTRCDFCGSENLIPFQGFEVCKTCGTTGEKVFETSSFLISENSNSTPTQYISVGKRLHRTGNLGSEIGYYRSSKFTSKDGALLTPEIAWKFRRLRDNYHNPSKNASSQTHLRTFIIFNKITSQLEIPTTIKERASYLYWKYANKFRGKVTNHVLLIALCLLFSIKENGNKYPIKFQEIVRAFNEAGHRVTNKNILKLALDLGVPLSKTPVRKSEDYIEKLTSQIVRNFEVKQEVVHRYGISIEKYHYLLILISKELLKRISKKERGGVQPFPFAASTLYIADRAISRFFKKVPILTQKKVATITGAKEFTIRDHCYKMLSGIFEREKMNLWKVIQMYL